MRKEMGLSSAASCGGFSDRENGKKLYIYIQAWGGWAGTVLPPWREFTTRPRADVHSDSLSDQVPVEVIGNLLIGTRRWDRWPRNHVVCCQGERQAIKETGCAASPSPRWGVTRPNDTVKKQRHPRLISSWLSLLQTINSATAQVTQ